MERNKLQSLLIFFGVILLPFTLLLYWCNKPKPKVDVLPIMGQTRLVESTDAQGDFRWDTVYHTLPDFKFVSHMGDTITKDIMAGKVVIADFFFTECKGICIPMSQNMARVQEEFIGQDDVFLLSHTVDPERDSVAKLHDYAQLYDVNPRKWLMLTGEKKDLYGIARNGYMITADQGDGGPEDFIHSERFVLLDKQQRIRGYYDGTSEEEIDRLREDVKRLLVTSDFPHTRNKPKN
jgi:protein SCO1/2